MYLASYISFAVFPVVVMIINQKILNLIQSKGDLKKILNYLVAYIVIVVLVEILENYFHIYEERNNREFEIYLEKKIFLKYLISSWMILKNQKYMMLFLELKIMEL